MFNSRIDRVLRYYPFSRALCIKSVALFSLMGFTVQDTKQQAKATLLYNYEEWVRTINVGWYIWRMAP